MCVTWTLRIASYRALRARYRRGSGCRNTYLISDTLMWAVAVARATKEGRYPAKEGDAYFIRLNTTVGFYSGSREGEPYDLILAVRSRFPLSGMPR